MPHIRLSRKHWDSEFFGREVHQVAIDRGVTAPGLQVAVARMDRQGVWGLEAQIATSDLMLAPLLEDVGFRLVDSRMTFITRMRLDDAPTMKVPFGQLRSARPEDMAQISKLTVEHLVDDPMVYSRFKNPTLFSREETVRYYDACNERVLRESPELFAVWDVDERVVAYFNYLRVAANDDVPMFKGILAVVSPDHRGHQAHNTLQSWLFERFDETEWLLDNTTQLSNLAVIRNHLRAGKAFHEAGLIFYRTNDRASWL